MGTDGGVERTEADTKVGAGGSKLGLPTRLQASLEEATLEVAAIHEDNRNHTKQAWGGTARSGSSGRHKRTPGSYVHYVQDEQGKARSEDNEGHPHYISM